MKQIKKFTVDGQTVSVPQDELEEFQGAAAEHGAKPDEIKGFRVTVSDGRAHDVEVPASELEDFASEARERGATFEPIRTERMEDGSVRKMTVGELSRFLRSDEYLKSDDHEKSVAANAERGLEPGSVGWAGVSGFFRGLGEGALAGANAVSGQMMKAIPETVLDIDAAAGRVLQGASKLGDNAVTRFAGRMGDATVATAEAAKAWLDGKIGSKTGDFLGYDDWSAKTADFIGNVAGMAYKFAPGMTSNAGKLAATGTKAVLENGGKVLPQAASGGRLAGLFGGNFGAYMEAVFASDGINACANVYDLARESGATPEEASALGGEAFLLNYFGGRAMMRAGGLAEGIKNPVLKFLAGGEAVSDAMALQAAGNKRLENAATGRPLGEGVAEDFWSGKLEGWLFHGVNAVPGAVLTKFENREAYRRHEEFRGKKILELLKEPDGAAYLYQMLSSDELDAAIRARRGVNPGERRATGEEFKALAVKAGLPETMTLSEANRVVDALSDQRDALNARVRIRMDDFQASALSETVDEYAKTRGAELGLDEKGLAELFARTWLKAAEKVTDARDLDDPEIRKVVVEKAAREAGGEISRERETERAEKSRLRGASVAEQVGEIASRRIVTWEDAESDGLIAKDAQGRWTGGMRQALNIAINGTEKLKESVSEGRIDGDTAEGLITAAQCELGARPPEERATLIDRILDFADGDSGLARRIMDKLSVREAGNETPLLDDLKRIEDEVTRETEAGFLSDADAPARAPETPYEGAADAARLKGTELRSVNGGELACTRFPEVRVEISQDGIRVDGLTDALVSNPENGVDMAAFVKRLSDIHQRTGLPVDLGDANAKSAVDALIDEVNRGGLAKAQAKLETRAKLLGLLFRTTLGNGVTYDEGRFRTALEKSTNGRAFKDSHGNIYGFVDGDGVLHFNPAALNFNTPFHEYGHLALEALKGINRPLWERGMALVRESAYFREIKGYAETEGHEYSYLKGREDMIADEALATLIGNRGERLVQERGLEAQLKAWLKEVWKAFKSALGVADLTEEQIEKMTLGEFVDTINAELLKGSEFGTRKRAPLAKSSVRAYDESDGSGSNGLLRWKNDRGYLFALPVDLERTQPGGKVVLARDDANVTDWIEARLHGLELRLSEAGKVYVKGRNGFEGELAEIFGRYPTIGRNDGLAAQIAQETGRAEWSEAKPEELVAGLLKDREGYRSWTEARAAGTGQDALAAREEEHYRNQAEGAAARRWQDSGMGVAEYIRDMAERGEPGFDVDWESAREIEHDRVTGLLKNLEDVGLMSVAGERGAAEKAETEHRAVEARYTNADGTRKPGWMKAPNGKPTKLTERQWVQVRTPSFKAWFGDWEKSPANASKVVDENGEPLVVYHGTPNGKFWTFDKNRIGETWNADESGFFFTNDRKIAEDYTKPYFRESTADPNLFAVYLSIRNPLVVDAKWWKANFGRSDIYRHDAIEIWDTEQRTILEAMRAGGHDGVIINPNPMGGAAKMYMVPEPTQIKSATDNTGAFDAGNPDIRFSVRRVTPEEDAAYMDAVRRGDMKAARTLLKAAWERSGYSPDTSYKDAHAAPSAPVEAKDFKNVDALKEARDEGWDLNLWAIAKGITGQPDDFFGERGPSLYGYDDAAGRETQRAVAQAIADIRGGNDKTRVIVYRAVPKGVKLDGLQSGGQWVSPSKTYAENHGKSRFGDSAYRIVREVVRAENLWWDGNDAREWGYDDGRQYVYLNAENGMKLATVTYDDAGNVIPLSKRFDHANPDVRFSVGRLYTGDGWRSNNYERRLAEGWTPRPEGVTPEELHALEAVVPERHHVGSEPHGSDVVLEAVYPPDYASSAVVRFVKQFNGNASDLSDVRKALYLIYGGHTHSRSRFEKMNRPELARLDRAGREERQRRHDSLLEQERKVHASRQAVQKELGYPAYKSDARWQDLDAEYRRIHAERLSPSAGERAVSEENERRQRAYDETKDARFEAYRDRRVSEGWRLLDEVARRRAVSPLSAFVNGDESRFSVGSGPLIDKAAFVAGRVRVGATAEGPDGSRVSESTPGALAASRELSSQGTTPLNALGSARRMSLPISEMEHLRKVLTGDAHPAGVMGGRRVTRSAWHGKGGRLWLSADVFGTVDKTDRAREKERLKEHGFYRNEDPDWCATHLPGEIRAEYARSEDQLATQLENLGSRRERGVEPGGQAVATQVYADEMARIVLEMPRQTAGVLGGIQTIGRAFRREAARAFGGGAAAEDSAKAEAVAFLDWASGEGMSGNLTMDALTNAMFGKWLVMPREMEARAPKWSQAVERTIANDARLRDAFEEVSRHFSDEQATGRLVERIRKQQSQETEAALKQLRADAQAPISAGSRVADAKEAFLVGFHDKFAPVTVRVDEKVKSYVKARREVLKRTTDPDERAAISAEIDLFMGEVGRRMHRLELSRTAYERGAYNEGLRYFIQSVALEDKASHRWGLTEEDRSLYLRLNRIIETQGRAASDGMSARQARIALDEMKARMGPAAWSKMEQYGREFFAIHERELLDDARLTTAFGKPFVDYLRTQVNYTATTRTFSVEELAKIDVERAKMRKLGVAGGDDIVSEMYAYAGANGAGEMTGETLWTASMKGSMAAAQEVRSATWTKVDRLMQFLRRNQMVIDLREALVAAGVEGVRDLSRTDGATFPSDPKGRYGHINFVEGGEKRTLVVPRQIADAFKVDPDSAPWLTKANGFIRKLFIDWNPAYWAQNVKRNQDSIEKNMPGMRETYLKTALRAVAPGLGSATDLVLQALVRNVPVAGALFGENTMLAYIPKAERFVRIIESPGEWQRDLWRAEDAGDLPKVQRLRDDFAGVMEMLRGNFLVAPEQAYSGPETSFAADALGKKGLKTLEQIERETAAKSKTRKFVDAVNVFQKNARQQVREDELAKVSAYLHDRAIYGLERSVEESGLIVKQNVSIAEGERAGRLKRPLQWGVAQFFNMVEKGVVRHWKALKERPGETLVKDGKVWIGRFIGALLSSGVLMKLMLDDSDGDEEKAKKKYGFIYGYANAFHRAYQNCSEYVKENYNIVPIWNSADGMTSVILGGALTDEDKLIVPSADFAAWTIAHRMGIAGEPSLGKALANSTFKAITPDLQLAGPLVTFLRDTVQSIFIDNPTDYFRGAPVYDKDLHAHRNDSWEMRGQFAAAVGARLWNDFGGRAFLTADVNGVDNGRGSAPETLETALRRIPVLSPALARMVKVQVGSPAKRGEAIREERGRRQGVVRICAAKLVDGTKGGVWWHARDPAGFERQIASWTKTYGLDAADVASIRAKYFNAFIQNTNREAFDKRDIRKLFIEGRKQGLTDSQLWVMLGEM